MAALCSGRIVPGARSFAKLLIQTRGRRERRPSISVTLTRPHTSRESVARFLFTGSAVKPRDGACRKLKKTLRALESKFSRGTNIINHQFWVSSGGTTPVAARAHTRGCEFYSKEGRTETAGRDERERARKMTNERKENGVAEE